MGSFDPDHALAIILQAKFNKEAKKQKDHVKENENFPEPVGLSNSKPAPKASLIDPEWEVTDPCPDIHGLFLAFNERFFWGRLLGIEVKWSPQMTSCAGICVYEGRNGLCSVRLSAPLLKLRPRSDLVETLLHEMIHAYLFVTQNNRDRDGHGPEFHKHMNRINKEAGTNITVYHSFHAEVKLYQQHWWRCDGPCQRKPPFFGMVKRAKNRAPGPNDFWWADHQAACGGQFIKVREPEGYRTKQKSKENKVFKPTEGDIRSFFKKPATINGISTPSPKPLSSGKAGSNVFFKNLSKGGVQPSASSSVNRVVGFVDLSSNSSKPSEKTPPRMFGGGYVLGGGKEVNSKKRPIPSPRGGMLANRGGGTLVVSGTKTNTKTDDKPPSPNTKLRIDQFKVFSGSGFTLGGASSSADRSRSRLLNLGNELEKKRRKSDGEGGRKQEQTKSVSNTFHVNTQTLDVCRCSVCNESMSRGEVEGHMEHCLGLRDIFNDSTINELKDIDEKEISEINKKSKITSCPICAINVEGDINKHLDECLNSSGIINVFEQSTIEIVDSDSPTGSKNRLSNSEIDPEKSDLENKRKLGETEFVSDLVHDNAGELDLWNCPVCKRSIPYKEIEVHTERCLELRDIFSNNTIGVGDISEQSEVNNTSSFLCPVCAKCIIGDMNSHLDKCLNTPQTANATKKSTVRISGSESPIVVSDGTSPKDTPITITDSESPVFLNSIASFKPTLDFDSDVEIIESENRVACMICGMRFGESRINAHVNECLDSLSD